MRMSTKPTNFLANFPIVISPFYTHRGNANTVIGIRNGRHSGSYGELPTPDTTRGSGRLFALPISIEVRAELTYGQEINLDPRVRFDGGTPQPALVEVAVLHWPVRDDHLWGL